MRPNGDDDYGDRHTTSFSCSHSHHQKFLVIINGAKDITEHALHWALTVAKRFDKINLVVLAPFHKTGRKIWTFPLLGGDCGNFYKKEQAGLVHRNHFSQRMRLEIENSCCQMMHKLDHEIFSKQVKIKVKVLPLEPPDFLLNMYMKAKASWIVIDKRVPIEHRCLPEELQCTVVLVKASGAKILKLDTSPNIIDSVGVEAPKAEANANCNTSERANDSPKQGHAILSSPDLGTTFTATDSTSSSLTSSEQEASPLPAAQSRYFLQMETSDNKHRCVLPNKEEQNLILDPGCEIENYSTSHSASCGLHAQNSIESEIQAEYELSGSDTSFRLLDKFSPSQPVSLKRRERNSRQSHERCPSSSEQLIQANFNIALLGTIASKGSKLTSKNPQNKNDRFSFLLEQESTGKKESTDSYERKSSVTSLSSFDKTLPQAPPPLCSICQHKPPVFGKPPRLFIYSELHFATNGFSPENFLAEGGFGSVYRGILADGRVVAVKQHKLASSQGQQEFFSEVSVLSCAQHRNVVMLIGFCLENQHKLLVYEYVCNGSLDKHLYGKKWKPLDDDNKKISSGKDNATTVPDQEKKHKVLNWKARYKIAIGAARGLRYLHEECRVGCIIHRDLRPNNILLTHDFEPLVGDFGLAKCQPDGNLGVQTRVIGTFGYLAPEYTQSSEITEKADVFSFGVVLIELVTGRKAVDLSKPRGEQFLTEWARPLLQRNAISELMDPHLGNKYSEHQVRRVITAATHCIQKDFNIRPKMSQLLRILEGDIDHDVLYGSRLNDSMHSVFNLD